MPNKLGVCHKRHDLVRCRWPNIPVPLCVRRFHQFAVMIERYPAVRVSQFQRG